MSGQIGRSVGLIFKRVLDIAIASVLLVVLSPVFAAIAAAVRISMGSPVLFRQTRPGRDEAIFELVKFRTMVPSDGMTIRGRHSQRITPLGHFLRRYGFDELPELVNVLKGDMSIIGPRPLLVEYLSRYTAEQSRRHDMRPGVTGLAQVSGRQGLLYSRKLELDVWYVDHWSLWLDLKVLWRTVAAVFGKSGLAIEDLNELDDIGLMGDEPWNGG